MQRDWKTIRVLLEHFEAETICEFLPSINKPADCDLARTDEENLAFQQSKAEARDKIFGHLLLLMDSDLVNGVIMAEPSASGRWVFSLKKPRLTMKGHDTLDAIRSDTVWNAVKQRAKDSAMPVTLELILAVLKKLSLLA